MTIKKTKKGLYWQARLREVFEDYSVFLAFCVIYRLHKKLNFKTSIMAWKANPIIERRIFPSDLYKITKG